MTTLLQISDAHFGTEQPPVVQALLQLARGQAPDLVVMSGDITQRARRSQFKAARAFVDQLKPAALLTIPGNHDIPLFNLTLRAFAPYSNYSRCWRFARAMKKICSTATGEQCPHGPQPAVTSSWARDIWTVQAGTAVSWRIRDERPGHRGVIELKSPSTLIFTKPRKDVIVLSRDAATGLAQAPGHNRFPQERSLGIGGPRSHGPLAPRPSDEPPTVAAPGGRY